MSAWFSFLLVAIVAATALALREASRSGDRRLPLLRVVSVSVLAGVAGGRLGHLLTANRDHYLSDPLALLRFWEGGMVLYGGLACAAVAAVLSARSTGGSLRRMADSAAPGVALGIALGRLGCLSAGCCYGRPIDWGTGIEWPWGLVFLEGAVPEPLRGVPLHPTQLYAAANGLLLCGLLLWLRARQRWDGQVAGWFLVGYGLTRPVLEAFRLDLERGFLLPDVLGETISTSQALSLPVVVAGVALLFATRAAARREGTLGLGPRAAAEQRLRGRIEVALAGHRDAQGARGF